MSTADASLFLSGLTRRGGYLFIRPFQDREVRGTCSSDGHFRTAEARAQRPYSLPRLPRPQGAACRHHGITGITALMGQRPCCNKHAARAHVACSPGRCCAGGTTRFDAGRSPDSSVTRHLVNASEHQWRRPGIGFQMPSIGRPPSITKHRQPGQDWAQCDPGALRL